MERCACIYTGAEDCDPPLYLLKHEYRARQKHKCTECNRTIKPGEKYEQVTGKWYDQKKHSTFKTCADCLSMRTVFFCDGYFYKGIWEAVEQHVFDMEAKVFCDGVKDLTLRAKERLFKLVEEYWKRHPEEEGDKDE